MYKLRTLSVHFCVPIECTICDKMPLLLAPKIRSDAHCTCWNCRNACKIDDTTLEGAFDLYVGDNDLQCNYCKVNPTILLGMNSPRPNFRPCLA